ncbi:putative Type II secretory pathway, component ExeA [Vibrio nigripulchritudo SOn1]|uniref:Type II secretory pathway, component ExeA n=1 Tax=Vibrio nigripulchritudo SOn1 TaxID=1238450 RepID=A0AAV2VQY9_9VIBR|nr:ExeA family protein [Vibrio nigripulchritudo]CCO46957.1 putative Type II secretory pathway, component ExeA [Vibrio nigripulchritudo SOn1]
MYKDFFGFTELPFSIVPSSKYLYLSARHREAMNHLQSGLGEGGGFAMLTGEVGTGKTTVSKAMLSALGEETKAALILNPTYSSQDLLEAICDEFGIEYPDEASLKILTQSIQQFLLDNHDNGFQTLLIIDEAQHLLPDVLEQLRLLTNLETDSQKLLKVLLIGQPELQAKLQTTELRQLAQRITGRYHLLPLNPAEIGEYIDFRLALANGSSELFEPAAVKTIARFTQGIPRLINLVCDKCLQYASQSGVKTVNKSIAQAASEDVMAFQAPVESVITTKSSRTSVLPTLMLLGSSAALAAFAYFATPLALQKWMPEAPREVRVETQTVKVPVEQTLAPILFGSHDAIAATLKLFNVWGLQGSVRDSECERTESAYYCTVETGTLDEVGKQNRPVVFALNVNNQRHYAVLFSLNNDNAQLLLGDERVEVPRFWLEEKWAGEYRTLWHDPIAQTLKLGNQGEPVAALEDMLSKALGESSESNSIFDESLKEKVEAFQRWQGLFVDGIVGAKTLQLLDLITNESAPTLTPKKEEPTDV